MLNTIIIGLVMAYLVSTILSMLSFMYSRGKMNKLDPNNELEITRAYNGPMAWVLTISPIFQWVMVIVAVILLIIPEHEMVQIMEETSDGKQSND